jgi:hypothetical protein
MTLFDTVAVGPVTAVEIVTSEANTVLTVAVSVEVEIPNQYTPATGFVAAVVLSWRLSPAFTVPGTVISTGELPPPLEDAAVVQLPVTSFTTQPDDGNVTGDCADTVIVPTPVASALATLKAIVSVTLVAPATVEDRATVTAPTPVPIDTGVEATTAASPDVLTLAVYEPTPGFVTSSTVTVTVPPDAMFTGTTNVAVGVVTVEPAAGVTPLIRKALRELFPKTYPAGNATVTVLTFARSNPEELVVNPTV